MKYDSDWLRVRAGTAERKYLSAFGVRTSGLQEPVFMSCSIFSTRQNVSFPNNNRSLSVALKNPIMYYIVPIILSSAGFSIQIQVFGQRCINFEIWYISVRLYGDTSSCWSYSWSLGMQTLLVLCHLFEELEALSALTRLNVRWCFCYYLCVYMWVWVCLCCKSFNGCDFECVCLSLFLCICLITCVNSYVCVH